MLDCGLTPGTLGFIEDSSKPMAQTRRSKRLQAGGRGAEDRPAGSNASAQAQQVEAATKSDQQAAKRQRSSNSKLPADHSAQEEASHAAPSGSSSPNLGPSGLAAHDPDFIDPAVLAQLPAKASLSALITAATPAALPAVKRGQNGACSR